MRDGPRPNFELLEDCCKIVESRATPDNFTMTTWKDEIAQCGFRGCFMGHIVDSGRYPELEFHLSYYSNYIRLRPDKTKLPELCPRGFAAAACFFSIPYDTAEFLFNFHTFGNNDAESVVATIRNWAARERPHYED